MDISNNEQIAKIHGLAASSKAYERLTALFDSGSMTELDSLMMSDGSVAEVITAAGTVDGVKVFAFAQNTDVASGAISAASAAKTCRLMRMAGEMGAPVIGIYDSNGARLKQGAKMLDACAAMLSASSALSGVVLRISIVAGACVGSNAILAANSDVVICCKDAQYGIDTSGVELSANDAETKGNAHIIVNNDMEAISATKRMLSILPANNLEVAPEYNYAEPAMISDAIVDRVASDDDCTADIINSVVDAGSFVELSAGYAMGVVTGFASIAGRTVGVCATRFGKNNGVMCSWCAGKLARFVKLCDSFSIPVVTFIDSAGFESVKDGSVVAQAYSESTSVRIAVVVGAAYGAAYMAMASRSSAADITLAWNSAVISPLAPATAAAIMYNEKLRNCADPVSEREQLVNLYKQTDASAFTAAQHGSIDDIIAPSVTRSRLIADLTMLEDKRASMVQRKHTNMWF